jgi:hypothetical protein
MLEQEKILCLTKALGRSSKFKATEEIQIGYRPFS